MRKLIKLFLVAGILCGVCYQSNSFGRGGGGHSFSGSHSSSSFGSSHSSSTFVTTPGVYTGSRTPMMGGGISFFHLLILLIIVLVVLYSMGILGGERKISSLDDLGIQIPHASAESVGAALQELLNQDPEFSLPLFKDFCYALYSTLHHARGKGKVALFNYSAYFSEPAAQSLLDLQKTVGVHPILGVVIGSFQILSIRFEENHTEIRMNFEANYTEDWSAKTPEAPQKSFYTNEVWVLVRNKGVQSKFQPGVKQIQCPACGAAAQSDLHGRCPSCGQVVRSGAYDWFIESIPHQEVSERPPLLTTTVEEEGEGLPTVFDPYVQTLQPKVLAELNESNFDAVQERVQQIFYQLQLTWSKRDLRLLRPYETDALYESHLYWMDEYKKQRLFNRLEDVKISQLELCKIFIDAHYISLTYRVYASMKDWTEHEDGSFVCGSKLSARSFSEYWTVIRSRNYKPTVGGFTQCPACGASLKINQTGDCEYCHNKVTSGEFDWVLSSIEQDEAYRG